jgi:hypothetical protein
MSAPALARIRETLAWTAVICLGAAACQPAEKPLPGHVGLWESTYRGRGGEANSIVLHPDSLVDRYFLKAHDFHFSVFSESLRVQAIVPDSFLRAGDTIAPQMTLSYSVRGDTLVRSALGGSEWFLREDSLVADPTSILGSWKLVRSTQAFTLHSYHRYRADSVLEVRLPVSVKHGVYKLEDDSLFFFFHDAESSRCALSLAADTLELTRTFTNGTFTFGYLRSAPEPWYRLEEY